MQPLDILGVGIFVFVLKYQEDGCFHSGYSC